MSGTDLILDAETMISNGPTVDTQNNAASGYAGAAYPSAGIVDYTGMLKSYRDSLKGTKLLLTELYNITNPSDPNYAILAADIATLGG